MFIFRDVVDLLALLVLLRLGGVISKIVRRTPCWHRRVR